MILLVTKYPSFLFRVSAADRESGRGAERLRKPLKRAGQRHSSFMPLPAHVELPLGAQQAQHLLLSLPDLAGVAQGPHLRPKD